MFSGRAFKVVGAVFLIASITSWYFFYSASKHVCGFDFPVVKFVKVISNKDGKIHRLAPHPPLHGPLNHAYRKLATQSKDDSSSSYHGAFRATDGRISGTTTLTDKVLQPHLDVHLNEVINVSCVRIWNRDDEFVDRLAPFMILLSLSPFGEDMNLIEAEHISIASKYFYESKKVITWNLDKPVLAKFVRLQLQDENILHIHEVEVFDTHVTDDYIFIPNYFEEGEEPPIVPTPSSFASFLAIAGNSLNLSSPIRAFTSQGTELTPDTYYTLFIHHNINIPEIYISEGEDFVGDVRVCVVFLCTAYDYLDEVFSNVEILAANVFYLYQYTIVIFYSWGPQDVGQNKDIFKQKFPYLNIRFVDVSTHFPPTLPKHLLNSSADTNLVDHVSACTPGNWSLNHFHMSRFWSIKLWFEPILKEYDLIWRIEPNVTIDQPIKRANFLREMKSKYALFAYWCRFQDTLHCNTSIKEATETFAGRTGLQFKRRIGENTAYWSGFGVYATEFFCHNKDWLEYVDYLDSLGGHYNRQWSEQNILPIALSLFLDLKQLFWMEGKNIQLYHDHKPKRNCRGM